MEIFILIAIVFLVVGLFAFSLSESKGLNSPHARGKKQVLRNKSVGSSQKAASSPDTTDSNQQLS